MVSTFPNHATLIWRYFSFYLCTTIVAYSNLVALLWRYFSFCLCTTIVAYSNLVALLWRCGNKNVDIKLNAHDVFSGITFIRYTPSRKVGRPNDLKSWEQQPNGISRIAKNQLRSPILEGGRSLILIMTFARNCEFQ